MAERQRRLFAIFGTALLVIGATAFSELRQGQSQRPSGNPKTSVEQVITSSATEALGKLMIKGRAPKTDYSRSQFGSGWRDMGNCDIRNIILARDMTNVQLMAATDCRVVSGILTDPYTGKTIAFMRGANTSDDVQIDHVVALSDAWQKGAQQLSPDLRVELANDPLNLLAVDGKTNNDKSDSDAASWLPPNKAYRCQYIARQIAVKLRYTLWVTQAEHDAMSKVLVACPDQQLPRVTASTP